MLKAKIKGTGTPGDVALVLMHFLGGSTREWDEVVGLLGDGFRTVAVDLPGFGEAAGEPGYSVAEMADAVEELIARLELGRYVLVGHSMSGKVSAVLARRAAETAHGRLAGLILVAPSPPSPEPMTDDKRAGMLESLGAAKDGDEARAKVYIGRNEERDIPPAVLARTVDEVLKMNRAAWVAWLESGSREDWGERVGVLDLPALVVAGEKDASLGEDSQRKFTLRHFSRAELKVVEGCSHLVPLERPTELAEMMRAFVAELGRVPVPAEYLEFIASERVSPRTRAVLEARMAGPEPTDMLTPEQMVTLRAMLARIVPQKGEGIDLAGYVAASLAKGKGDGWRYAVLPEDAKAYRDGLDSLRARGFDEMSDEDQDAALRALEEKKGSAEACWFEEVRGDATTAYISHPATLARIGHSGIGVGGANTQNKGFVAIGIGDVEAWEPKELVKA
ncbi:alpha/beta hydrolase [Granulicella tundricola]|uniref:Alpha/beta hydrolase fold protein n=1 Tax=Granulicella tundricola (strain ATCC BAA-1859 / DSM 23138 / MP5ACTX9) TaxID=1198114 RepID=E8WVU3_GRATM|nr:alpha/beta hydrolase [Granulicella tundricola]ADW70702.1 alpha/beta hydrolase fold protein [Granulicella tundricola MP5ACTX9]